jgi:predicted nucleic acid-binding protein
VTLTELPLRRVGHRALLRRCWELRQNLSVYDADYVALAELLEAVLVTADARLAAAPGVAARWTSPADSVRPESDDDRCW